MITLKVIVLIWTILMSTYALVGKITGTGVFGTLIIKLLSLVTLIYSGYELIRMLP
jgi:hypothetical protein